MRKIEIVKVILFDDMECYKNKTNFLEWIRKAMHKSFQECKTLRNFEISQNLEVEFFFIKNDEYYKISGNNNIEMPLEWNLNIGDLFQPEEGYLILCDYQWKGQEQDINKQIYMAVKDNPNVIFVVYTSVMYDEAQRWIDELLEVEHSCKVVDILLTIPSDDASAAIRSIEEAMLDEW